MKQYRLRIIAAVVCQRHNHPSTALSLPCFCLPQQIIIAHIPRLLLQRNMRRSFPGNLLSRSIGRLHNPQFFAECLHKPLVPQTFLSANPMLHMNTPHLDCQTLPDIPQQSQQSHRISASGHAHQHPIAGGHHILFFHESANTFLKFPLIHKLLPFQCF